MEQKLEVLKGICNICIDKIYLNKLGKISEEELKDQIDAGVSLLKSYVKELEEENENK